MAKKSVTNKTKTGNSRSKIGRPPTGNQLKEKDRLIYLGDIDQKGNYIRGELCFIFKNGEEKRGGQDDYLVGMTADDGNFYQDSIIYFRKEE